MQAFLLPSAADTVQIWLLPKIENGLERGFVKHRLNSLLITDPKYLGPTIWRRLPKDTSNETKLHRWIFQL